MFKPAHFLNYSKNCKPKVQICKNNKVVSLHIAKEVAKHFLPQPPKGYCVLDFKDNDPYNVKSDNLFWRKPKDRHKIFVVQHIDGEEWKQIEGYENYMISNKGRVKVKAHQKLLKNRIVNIQEHILIPFKTKQGYLCIRLGRKSKSKTIHRLVAKAFIPNPNNKPCIDHINTNRQDNRVENLRWCTYSENMQNPITSKKMSNLLIGRNINQNQVRPVVCIKEGILYHTYPSIASTKIDGYAKSSIYKCLHGKQKFYKGLQWMYLSDYETSINKSKTA